MATDARIVFDVALSLLTPLTALFVWFLFHERLVGPKSVTPGKGRLGLSLFLLAGLLTWIGLAFGLAVTGVFADRYGSALVLVLAFVVPYLAMRFLSRSAALAAAMDALPNHWLVAIQLYRLLGIMFLFLYADGLMPGEFALPSGVGDLLVGTSAPLVAYLVAARKSGHLVLARLWNYVGIADLVIAVTMGALTAPTLVHVLSRDEPNVLITSYPLVLVPTFSVPFSLLLHLISLRILRRHA